MAAPGAANPVRSTIDLTGPLPSFWVSGMVRLCFVEAAVHHRRSEPFAAWGWSAGEQACSLGALTARHAGFTPKASTRGQRMRLAIDLDMSYALQGDDPALLSITAAQTNGQTVLSSDLEIENATLRWIDGEGKVGQRVWAVAEGGRLSLRYRAQVDVTRPDIALPALAATPSCALPADVVTFLRPCRLCPSDLLRTFADQQFGHLEGGDKIAAILDWTATSLVYVPGSSFATTTAYYTFVMREGVCRDYAHLVCGLARAASIPARYATGYSAGVKPPDFHAVAEVWLDGAWHLVDATGMSTAGGLAIIGAGRDAGDVPFMETEKWANLIHQRICVSEDRSG